MSGVLSHSPADVVAALIVSLGGGTDPLEDAAEQARSSWPVKVSRTPDRPDQVLVVTDTAGRDLARPHPVGRRAQLYGVQIKVRACTHAAGWAKASSLAELLSLGANVYDAQVALGEAAYVVHSVQFTGPALALGAESGTERRLFTLNALVGIRQL
jgi:hypothetical protein